MTPGLRSSHSLTLWGRWTYTPGHWVETGAQARVEDVWRSGLPWRHHHDTFCS